MKIPTFFLASCLLATAQNAAPVFSPQRVGNYLCDIYLAPSDIGGWGVYAGRDFDEGEIVEIAPRYVPLKSTEFMHNNALDDFHYGFTFQRDPEETSFGAAIFGMSMFYNHGVGAQRNVVYTSFGFEPDKHMTWGSMMIGFVANRDIRRGEELLSSYGETERWFTDRGLEMAQREEQEIPSQEELTKLEQQQCAKSIAGIGHSTWIDRVVAAQDIYELHVPYIQKEEMLPLQDHPTAVAKEFVQDGSLIEQAPALVVPMATYEVSPLEPMIIAWADLDPSLQEVVQDLREDGVYRMKGIDTETGRLVPDVLEFFEDSAILPAAGNIGLVRKVGPDGDSNCRLGIESAARDIENADIGSSGIILKLYATRDIQPGEELLLNLPDSSSWHTKTTLSQHLALTGQPIPKHLVDTYNPGLDDISLDDEEEPEL
ncbi:expressed unknown protein [Seminavis robusta]|uniref:SET domain-containing protein n=1 Tax=Seminavis robusta TaxID=568900 RepID=A0A9N8HCM2_9STRA|nr:expressed unknown protein [Seminavis robusta]|eukprot:Sro224_g091640.1 n/a (429) ;mRNA; f:44059-45345